MADIVVPKIEVNIQFQVLAVIFSNTVKAKGCFVHSGQADWAPTTVQTF
jgi:hypothetical protein